MYCPLSRAKNKSILLKKTYSVLRQPRFQCTGYKNLQNLVKFLDIKGTAEVKIFSV